MKLYEKTLSSETIFEGKVIKVTVDTAELENGNTSTREVVHHNGGACMVAITETGEILLTTQYRYALGQVLLELPAGKVEKGEDPFETAKRELTEEAGVTAEEYIDLGKFYPTCGYCTEVIHLYGAKKLKTVGQNLDADEFLNVSSEPLETLAVKCLNGEIRDGKTIAGVLRLQYAMQQGLF